MVKKSSEIQYEVVDYVPGIEIIKKKVLENNNWTNRKFIKIPIKNIDRTQMGTSAIENWCYERLGPPAYLQRWWKLSGYIILEERSYVIWKLSE